jgi:hypothetical protein
MTDLLYVAENQRDAVERSSDIRFLTELTQKRGIGNRQDFSGENQNSARDAEIPSDLDGGDTTCVAESLQHAQNP